MVPAACAIQGGVGLLAQGALVDTTRDDRTMDRLRKTTRWQEALIPVQGRPKRRRRRNFWAPAGIYVASLYGRANADSADLFRDAATAAPRA